MKKLSVSLGLVTFSLLAAAAAACGSDDPGTAGPGPGTPEGGADTTPSDAPSDPCPATGKGTITIQVSGLPAGVKAKVTIDGPGGKQDLDAPVTVPVTTGTYGVSGAIVTQADPIVRSVFTAAPVLDRKCVKNGETINLDVAYTLVPTSNKLWTTAGNGDAALVGFSSAKVAATATQTSDVAVQLDLVGATAFDRQGGLWAIFSGKLGHYSAATLATSGMKTPDITVEVPNEGIPALAGIAFDGTGNLWIAAPTAGKVHRVAAAELLAGGTPANLVTISGLTAPGPLAFDATGNLWVGDRGKDAVVEFKAGRLGASTAAAPDVVLTAQTPLPVQGPLTAPSGIAFDAAGNMWVDFNDTMTRFTTADRATTALLTPAVQIPLDVAALSENIAFDESGGLWFAYSATKFARLAPAQLTASAVATPATIITAATLGYASQIAFYPAAAALPIFGKVP
jgi:hypothetical protein